MIEGVHNIIFDLGGVIIDIDYLKTVDAFNDLGLNGFDREFVQSHQSGFFQEFEKGHCSEEDFYQYIQKFTALSHEQIDHCWNAMLIKIPLRRLQILQQLQLHYNTFLLSNTNSIHEKAFNSMLKNTCGFDNFAVFFDKIYLSHRIGMRKPDADIFEKILTENSLKAEHTLFIDDSVQHIEAAEKLGLKTIHLTPEMKIEEDVFKPRIK